MNHRSIVPYRGGVWRDLFLHIKLVLRLMGDRRVNFFLKFLPLLALAYLLWPYDPVPLYIPVIGALDDAAVIWLGTSLFIELCPSEVVQEHLKHLTSNLELVEKGEVVDGQIVKGEDNK
ncbi:MAG: DUF1232 domain-containing protein [Anaerolineales bacterium]